MPPEPGLALSASLTRARPAPDATPHPADRLAARAEALGRGEPGRALDLYQEFEEGRTPAAPILLLLARPADVPLARRSGVEGWLIKPLDRFRLRRAARALTAGDAYHEPSGLAV